MTKCIALFLAAMTMPLTREASATQVPAAADTRAAAEDFYVFTLPLLEIARRRDAQLALTGANAWKHTRDLADDRFREVTTPNNDTLYSTAFLDLRNGPARITVPATGKRYLSLHLLDFYSNAIGFAGSRVGGGRAETVTVVGPGASTRGLTGRVIVSPTPWVWAILRVLVTAPEDLAAARAVQDHSTITGAVPGPRPAPIPPDNVTPEVLRAATVRLLTENPPPPRDSIAMARFRTAGLLGASSVPGIAEGFGTARDRLRRSRRPGTVVNGWIYPRANLGDYGADYAYRGSVAVNGLGALVPAEAMYLRSAAPTPTGLFEGKRAYRLHFAANALPPVDGFWSLSMYERVADGGFYYVTNPQHRYAIGDRTPGLTRNADGSLDIWIGNADPGPLRRANWLPAPAGPFALSLRAYLPGRALLAGEWRAPAVLPE